MCPRPVAVSLVVGPLVAGPLVVGPLVVGPLVVVPLVAGDTPPRGGHPTSRMGS